MPTCPDNEPFRILDPSGQAIPPWVETMLNHIGDMEELKRQLKMLNERLADVREREKLEESPSSLPLDTVPPHWPFTHLD